MTSARTAEDLIATLGMEPIPEEGAWLAQGPRVPGLSTILALVADRPDGFSAMHRLEIDEGWQWIDGDPLTMLRLHPDGTSEETVLDAEHPQLLVPRGVWQGARTLGAWTLFSCWCAPAFEGHHFTLGDRATLTAAYPDRADLIAALTRQEER